MKNKKLSEIVSGLTSDDHDTNKEDCESIGSFLNKMGMTVEEALNLCTAALNKSRSKKSSNKTLH